MNIFLANSKDYNWNLCVEHNLFGIKLGRRLPEINTGDLILMRISGSRDTGVKAIWVFKKSIKVNSKTFVPWKDAEYGWIMECQSILTLDTLFREDFHGVGGYSTKIPEFPASRIQPSLIQLKPSEFKGYFKHILKEYGNEVDLNFIYKNEQINLHQLFSNIASGKPVNYAIENSKLSIDSNNDTVKEGLFGKPFASDKEEPTNEAVRSSIMVNRIIRDTLLSIRIKSLYDFKCQLCGGIIIAENGHKYAEAHHIQPLGKPHNGPDNQENIICLCPNCHVKLDYGIIGLNYEKIFRVKEHTINIKYITYHNSQIYNKILL